MRKLLWPLVLGILLLLSFDLAASAPISQPTVSFADSTMVTTEDAEMVSLSVTLSSSSTVTITVDYATQDGTAIGGEDYLPKDGTLTFTTGITEQVVSIALLNDELHESDETFCVVLTKTVSATLGLYPSVKITVTDDSDPNLVFLPMIMKRWPPLPYDPTLNYIDNNDGDHSYLVTWTELPTKLADFYELQEATNQTFTQGLRQVCSTTSQECTVSERIAGTYFYRVKGHNYWGESAWSNIQSAVVLIPGTLWLDAINNADGDGYYTVNWGVAVRANWYTLQEDDNAAFSSPTNRYVGTNLSWSAAGQGIGTYYYRVRAEGLTGVGPWSETRSTSVYPPATPYLNPIYNADGDGAYDVSWLTAARATGYTLQEDDNSSFNSPITRYSGPNLSWSASSQATGTYYYRVSSSGPTGSSGWSETRAVTVSSPGNPQIVFIFYDGAQPYYEGDEFAQIKNIGGRAINIGNWRLNAGDPGQNYYFPDFVMQPNQECRVYTNEYHPEWCGFNYGSIGALWNNSGDCGYLYNAGGGLVSTYCYP